jgi:protoporphyrinogen oxidase
MANIMTTNKAKTGIIGGGIAGLSLGSFLNQDTLILEKEQSLGGLSRSYQMGGIDYDIGPHIIFSKNKEVLNLHSTMIKTNLLKRSNQVFYKGRYVKYPFENDLSALPQQDRDYCLNEYLENPYENYSPSNMLQFFLKIFGEGITRTYLQPYNEKIWKFDPACMDMQMVERIPKPPREDVIASANGVSTEGYVHQLNFHYPEKGGFQTLINAYKKRVIDRGNEVYTGVNIQKISRTSSGWIIKSDSGDFEIEKMINCAPIHEFAKYFSLPDEASEALQRLLYNSIYIVMIKVRKDSIGDHFALYVPEKSVLFHRVSKLNYLGNNYCPEDGSSVLMAEVTFRPDSHLSKLSQAEIEVQVIKGLVDCGFILAEDVQEVVVNYEKYAYVIYDLDHKKNTKIILDYFQSLGIDSVGRFAQFEYLNTDGVVENTLKLARTLNGSEIIVGVNS